MSLELTDLIKDFIATNLLSKVELDFLESELWETLEHIDEITSLTSAPVLLSDLNLIDLKCFTRDINLTYLIKLSF